MYTELIRCKQKARAWALIVAARRLDKPQRNPSSHACQANGKGYHRPIRRVDGTGAIVIPGSRATVVFPALRVVVRVLGEQNHSGANTKAHDTNRTGHNCPGFSLRITGRLSVSGGRGRSGRRKQSWRGRDNRWLESQLDLHVLTLAELELTLNGLRTAHRHNVMHSGVKVLLDAVERRWYGYIVEANVYFAMTGAVDYHAQPSNPCEHLRTLLLTLGLRRLLQIRPPQLVWLHPRALEQQLRRLE